MPEFYSLCKNWGQLLEFSLSALKLASTGQMSTGHHSHIFGGEFSSLFVFLPTHWLDCWSPLYLNVLIDTSATAAVVILSASNTSFTQSSLPLLRLSDLCDLDGITYSKLGVGQCVVYGEPKHPWWRWRSLYPPTRPPTPFSLLPSLTAIS